MKLRMSGWGWRCQCKGENGRFACRVPPSPDVMANTFMEYKRSEHYRKVSFKKYLEIVGFVNPAADAVGMDDRAQFVAAPSGPQLLSIPTQAVVGDVNVKVLLVDFSDRPGGLPASHYEDLLFSVGTHPTGSMRDYFKEVSHGKVDVKGTVHGWLRMPQPYSFYTNSESGTRWNSYPRNAPRLAEDAVNAARAAGIAFDNSLDKFGRGIVTALFIIHAGRGAEIMPRSLQGSEIWSHKWRLRNPVNVGPGLSATIYLTVPHDCKVGVCAHELGHLAFEWQDFYDPNYAEDGSEWDGSGLWDLMAGGSYNGNGARPAHPAPLHKLQHGWITASTVKQSGTLTIKPYTSANGHVFKLVSPKFKPTQYLLLESRKKAGFDFDLPGEGLLVWKIDEVEEMFSADAAGMSLVQADGRGDLNSPGDWNQGDASDPFPGSEDRRKLGDTGDTSTSFPGARSGISLSNIEFSPAGIVKLDVKFAAVGGPLHTAPAAAAARRRKPAKAKPAKSKPRGKRRAKR